MKTRAWSWIIVIAFFGTLLACGKEEKTEKATAGPDSLAVRHDQTELSRIAVQEDAIGTAYGNILKIEAAVKRRDVEQAKKLAEETRYLLLAYIDSIEESNLPRLEERASKAVYDLDRMLFYLDSGDLEKAERHLRLCKIHLDSLRQLTGLKRVM
jgi:hypothetical protein